MDHIGGGGQYELPPGASQEQPGEDQRARLVLRQAGETALREWRQQPQLPQLRWAPAVEIFQCQAGLETRRGELFLRPDQPGELQVRGDRQY